MSEEFNELPMPEVAIEKAPEIVPPVPQPANLPPRREPLPEPRAMKFLDDFFQSELNRMEFEDPLFTKSKTGEALLALQEIRSVWLKLWDKFTPFLSSLPTAEDLMSARHELEALTEKSNALTPPPVDAAGPLNQASQDRMVACMVKAFAAGAASALEIVR